MDKAKQFRGHTDEAHPEIFNTVPPQPKDLKPGQLPVDQIHKFFDQGFLLVNSFFTPEELDPVRRRIAQLVDEQANKLYQAGKIKDLYKDADLFHRLIHLENDFPGSNILLHKIGSMPEEIQAVWSNNRLLNLVEQILGTSDILGHPVWNLRTKTPNNTATTVPWHQDVAYLDTRSYEVLQLTAWIPLLDTNESNGCMQVITNGHKTGKIADHQGCWKDTWYVMMVEDDIQTKLGCDVKKDIVTCEVPYGGLLLFSNVLPHHSLNNSSDMTRWSIDLRWQTAHKNVGFYDIKDGVLLRSSEDPQHKIDWATFNRVNRSDKALQTMAKTPDDFDTIIAGPWMLNWELVNRNRHTDAVKLDQKWEELTVVG